MRVALLKGCVHVEIFCSVNKQGLVLEDCISHISVGVAICKLSLALRVSVLLDLFLFSANGDKPQGL
jgi:hypothetical protein